jgi:hypothetical protein
MPRIERFDANGRRTVLDDRTQAEAVEENVARIRAAYEAQVALGVAHRGKVLQIDPASQLLLTAAVAQLTAGLPLSARFRGWRMADNTFLAVTPDQLKALAQAASDRTVALRDAMWTAIDAVRAARTPAEADAVAPAWPAP